MCRKEGGDYKLAKPPSEVAFIIGRVEVRLIHDRKRTDVDSERRKLLAVRLLYHWPTVFPIPD